MSWINDFIKNNYDLYEKGGNIVLIIVFMALGVASFMPAVILIVRSTPQKLKSMKKHSAFANACIAEFQKSSLQGQRPSNGSSRGISRRTRNHPESLNAFPENKNNANQNTSEFYFEFNDDYEISL